MWRLTQGQVTRIDMTQYEAKIGSVSQVDGLVSGIRRLHVGDNLEVMRRMEGGTVDLVYLDPPFNSNKNYKIVFRGPSVLKPDAYLPAFEDVWIWDDVSEGILDATLRENRGQAIAETLTGLLKVVGRDRLMAYLLNMTPRLIEIHRLLKSTGSVYLHCDPVASHYLKVIMDAVFGRDNFRNEIAWCYRGGGVPRRNFARKHDVILRYSKSDDYTFNPQYGEYSDASKALVNARGGTSIDGRERDIERGAHMPDWWSDINSLQTWSPERTGYPTQKPVRLLERIIRSSSNEGDVVMDPFCGCGTTMVAAEQLGRSWIGIDVEPMALSVLRDRFRQGNLPGDFAVSGLPSMSMGDLTAWVEMAKSDAMRFERGVMSMIPRCVPWRNRQDSVKGMDGVVSLPVALGGKCHAVVRVLGGSAIDVSVFGDLRGTLDGERYEDLVAGLLVTAHEPSEAILREASETGEVEIDGRVYPRISIVPLEELFRRTEQNSDLFPLK
ncbi:MAG: site-specific DNA-methyltransferase [Chloroflexi bacterium]|nr:site-specific DNA-methyltransferase [Chloroflexota bacterium]